MTAIALNQTERASWVEEPLELLLDEIPLGVLELDDQGVVGHANDAAQLLLGSPGAQEVSQTLSEMFVRAKEGQQLVETALSLGHLGEVRILLAATPCTNGYMVVLERSVATRLRAENAALRTMLSAATQAVPPRQAAQQALTTLGKTLSGSYLVLYEHDETNATLLPMAHVAVPAGHSACLSPKPIDPKKSLVGRVMDSGRPLHVANLSKSFFAAERELVGGEKMAAIALPVVGRGKPLGVLYVCGPTGILAEGELKLLQGLADAVAALIEHARQDVEIHREQQALKSLMDNLPDAVVEQNVDGFISAVGGRAPLLLGRPAEQLIGSRICDFLIPAEQQRFSDLIACAATSNPAVDLFTVQQPEGNTVTCEVSVHVGRSDGRGSWVRAIFRDISARLALEKEVENARSIAIQKDRLAMIGQLAAGVAHEINNPLAFVKANLSFIENDLREVKAAIQRLDGVRYAWPEARQLADKLDNLLRQANELTAESLMGIDRISTIVTSLKGMARQRPDEKVSFNPARAVNEAVMFFRGAKHRSDVVICEVSEMPFVTGEPGALGQVILNLLDNALDAMNGQGTVRVIGTSEDSRACIKVIDTGSGIPPEIQPHLFDPFFTTKGVGKGTGLGLYISHEIVRRFGGTLRFETGHSGTTFIVELPS